MCAATLRIFSAYGRAVRMRSWARRIFEAATISIEEDREKVLGGNAMRLFGLNGNGALAH